MVVVLLPLVCIHGQWITTPFEEIELLSVSKHIVELRILREAHVHMKTFVWGFDATLAVQNGQSLTVS